MSGYEWTLQSRERKDAGTALSFAYDVLNAASTFAGVGAVASALIDWLRGARRADTELRREIEAIDRLIEKVQREIDNARRSQRELEAALAEAERRAADEGG